MDGMISEVRDVIGYVDICVRRGDYKTEDPQRIPLVCDVTIRGDVTILDGFVDAFDALVEQYLQVPKA